MDDAAGYEIGFLLRQAHARAAQAFSAALAPLGIEGRHFAVLHHLAAAPHSQRQLVDLIGSDKSSMVRLVDDLEAEGLVTREASAQDRRVQVITMTGKGHAALRTARQSAGTVADGLLEHLSTEDRHQLVLLLREFVSVEGD